MSRIQATLLAVIFVGVQVCCAPPIRAAAAEAAAPMMCPIDGERPCEARQQESECDPVPELIATSTEVPAVAPTVAVVPESHPHPVVHVARVERDDFWFAQTRTIQLRI